jgi:hypothetical protein
MIYIDPTWSHSPQSHHLLLALLLSQFSPSYNQDRSIFRSSLTMKNETNKPVEKEKAAVNPPRRGQITANILRDVVQSVIAITKGKKSEECGGESSGDEKSKAQ